MDDIQKAASGAEPITILDGVRYIEKPITEAALKKAVKEVREREGELVIAAYVGRSDSLKGWVIHQIQVTSRDTNKLRLLLVPGGGRVTSLITKRYDQKVYASVQTLHGRLVDIVGEKTPLSLIFNLFKFSDGRS